MEIAVGWLEGGVGSFRGCLESGKKKYRGDGVGLTLKELIFYICTADEFFQFSVYLIPPPPKTVDSACTEGVHTAS
jgi:hypothetical protein